MSKSSRISVWRKNAWRQRRRHRAALLAALLFWGAAVVASAGAQPTNPTLAGLALDWSRGHFASPLICRIDGALVRGIRRVLITPGAPHLRPQVNRIVFVDLEVEDASRCFADLTGDVPNVTGSLQIRLPGRHHADTVRRDFRDTLRRKHGFEFEISSGNLRFQPVSAPPSPAKAVDFSGGSATLREIAPGSDHARALADFPSPRKLVLTVTAPDSTTLELPLFLSGQR